MIAVGKLVNICLMFIVTCYNMCKGRCAKERGSVDIRTGR